MSIPKEALVLPEKIHSLITLQYRGSIAHGMYVPKSDPNSIDDKDIIGCFIFPLAFYFGHEHNKKSRSIEKKYMEWDGVFYEFRRLMDLLMKGNPNVLSTLWVEEKNIIQNSWQWKEIVKNRDLFSTKQVYHSFVGYANGQFHRMEHCACEGYMGAKRKALVEQFGYDTKNAAHLIRLLTMAIEFLTEGKLYVERTTDATYLLDIKKGKYTLDEVKKTANEMFSLAREAYVKCDLPNIVDEQKVNKLMVSILENTFFGENENV